ncbi:MAG: GNAT family N-acetyltransferase [Bacteroidaceae bacterium]|nr:GNAT family N-acetyltransferase [Bacteroidaceae bacterium]
MPHYFPVVRTFQELTVEELYEILSARFRVFVMEQRCFYLDPDGTDYHSLHVFVRPEREVLAYARLFPEPEEGVWHVGRMLTTQRGQGLGRAVMQTVIQAAQERGATLLRMEAQHHAQGFYERFGFRTRSDVFEEAGIPHIRMERTL